MHRISAGSEFFMSQYIMVGDEIIVEGSDVSEYDLEVYICRHLGLPEPDKKRNGFLKRFL